MPRAGRGALAGDVSQGSAAPHPRRPDRLLLADNNNQVNKQVRIRRLTPFLAQKVFRFKSGSPGARLLVEQLRDFPCGDHNDGPDALEMAVRLGEGMFAQAQWYHQPETCEVLRTPDLIPWR